MERDAAPIGAPCGERGRQRGGVVRHHEVPGAQELGQVSEPRVDDPVARAVADEEPYLVAPQTAHLGRLVGLEPGRQHEVERACCCDHALSHADPAASALASKRPEERVSCSTRRRKAGADISGSGRWERSTPGSASWCICVFMSPGSTT